MLRGAKGALIKFEALGHDKICSSVPRMQNCPRMAELKEKRIFVTDFGPGEGEIELLIGSDYYTQWMTGNNFCLKNGLMVLETQFGWIVSGKLAGDHTDEHKN